MDRRAGACGASFLPSWPSLQCLSSAFRTDSLVLPICDPLVRQGWDPKVKGAIPKVGRFKARVCQTKGGNLSVWATNLQRLRRSRRRKNRQRRLQRSKLQNPRSKKRERRVSSRRLKTPGAAPRVPEIDRDWPHNSQSDWFGSIRAQGAQRLQVERMAFLPGQPTISSVLVASDDRCGRTPGSFKLRFPQGKLS